MTMIAQLKPDPKLITALNAAYRGVGPISERACGCSLQWRGKDYVVSRTNFRYLSETSKEIR
jgi:hypothetical protein